MSKAINLPTTAKLFGHLHRKISYKKSFLGHNHTERQVESQASSVRLDPIGSIVYMVMLYLTLGNVSGVDLERQVKHHHRLALVTLPAATDTDAWRFAWRSAWRSVWL